MTNSPGDAMTSDEYNDLLEIKERLERELAEANRNLSDATNRASRKGIRANDAGI